MEYGRLARQEAVRGGEHVGHEIRALHLQTSQRPSTLTPAPRRSRHFGTGAAGVTNGGGHRRSTGWMQCTIRRPWSGPHAAIRGLPCRT